MDILQVNPEEFTEDLLLEIKDQVVDVQQEVERMQRELLQHQRRLDYWRQRAKQMGDTIKRQTRTHFRELDLRSI